MLTAPTRAAIEQACLFLGLLVVAGCGESAASGKSTPVRSCFSIGSLGTEPGQFACPRVIAAGAGDRIFVIDKTGRVQRFSTDGRFEHQWMLPECENGYPSGIDVAPDGRIFVADTHYSRILVYDRDGNELFRFGSRGTGPGQLMLVTDVAVAPDGAIYVAEFGGDDRVSKFDARGRFLLSFGDLSSGVGALQRPSGLACDFDGSVWVADAGNHRICHFDRNGRFLGSFGELGREPGKLRYPRDVALSDDGLLVIADGENDRVQCFDRHGLLVGVWGSPGRDTGQFSRPLNVAVCGRRIYVADSANNRVTVIDGTATDLPPTEPTFGRRSSIVSHEGGRADAKPDAS